MVAKEVIDGFFSRDLDRVLAAVAAMGANPSFSHGRVEHADALCRDEGAELRFERGGPFSEQIFGALGSAARGERFGHVAVDGVVHPAAYARIGEALGAYGWDVEDVAEGRIALRDGEPVVARGDDAERTGASAIAEALRAKDPDHPLLAVCTIRTVPVPPPDARPFVRDLAPTMVDPWIGPTNEALNELVQRARREQRLFELGAPEVILRNETVLVQRAFAAFMRHALVEGPLVPPLASAPPLDEELHAIAFVRDDLLVVQRNDAVFLVGARDGRVVAELPPCACRLAGVHRERFALFYEFLLHPMLTSGDPSYWGSFVSVRDDVVYVADHAAEMSAVDAESASYVTSAAGLPRLVVENDEPEDLFYVVPDTKERRRLAVGGDRPRVLAYAPGMQHAWVGEIGSGTQIIELATGIPHAYPAEPRDDEDEAGEACAIAFADGAWRVLWPNGILADHLGARMTKLTPLPRAAAFDAKGQSLATIEGSEIVIRDVTGAGVRRFPMPRA